MDFESLFPHRLCLNLAKRQDRRVSFEDHFAERGITIGRMAAVNASYVRGLRGFASAGRYAHSLTTRIALRAAIASGARSLFIFEDDAIIGENFRAVLEGIDLPDDWGIFYLGCQHMERPTVVSKNLVRVKRALDTHAWGCHARHFRQILRQLGGDCRDGEGFRAATDVALAELHDTIPTYAAFPNLASQGVTHSDLAGGVYSNYDVGGSQIVGKEKLRGLTAQAISGRAATAPRTVMVDTGGGGDPGADPIGGRISFLFLTRSDHLHAGIWEDYWGSSGGHHSIYVHTKNRGGLPPAAWTRRYQIAESADTEWGGVGLVRAQLALLRAAFEDRSNVFFVFLSESCVPVRPPGDLRRLLSLDPRSRFAWLDLEGQLEADRSKAIRYRDAPDIPACHWHFHPQWVLLDREAAGLILEDDFTRFFSQTFAPDESYFGTVLSMRGFNLEEGVAPQNITWVRWPEDGGPHPLTFDDAPGELAAELMSSGCFFARKFSAASKISSHGLHLPRDPGHPPDSPYPQKTTRPDLPCETSPS